MERKPRRTGTGVVVLAAIIVCSHAGSAQQPTPVTEQGSAAPSQPGLPAELA